MKTKRLFIGTFVDSELFEFVYPEIKRILKQPALGNGWNLKTAFYL